MATYLPTVVAEVDALVAKIAVLVARLPADRLLHRAWWELAAIAVGLGGKDDSDSERAMAMRMVDYVQSVIASVEPNKFQEKDLTDENWEILSQDIQSLFNKLTIEYQMCLTACSRVQDPNLDMELEEFRVRAEILWMNVRGERYQPHEGQALLDVLTPHSDVLVRLFKISAPTLVAELEKILAKLTRGFSDAFAEFDQFRKDTLEGVQQLSIETGITDIAVLRDKLFDDPKLAARRDKVAGEIAGLDLFDLEKITDLPKALLDELAWSPGEEKDFFATGAFSGWPLREWPTMKRPFIRLGGRTLCFDIFALFDNFYRVLQRAIFRLEPNYRQTWNDRQQTVTEKLPFTYFERLLPSARVFQPVYYRWKVAGGRAQWHEADGILIYDDHLFVIEVKAGAFTYTAPATDLAAHIKSLQNLVLNPAAQGNRFVDFLESAPEVQIADADHNEIYRLRCSDFRHVTICAVTLDAFTELAARAHHLRKVGIDIGRRPVWALSIDDLRVYADLFDNPLMFLHFVEQRIRAAHSELVDLDDEMDHLGLYVAENNYVQYAAELIESSKAKLNFNGYRTPVDDYYSAIVRNEPPLLPKQKMPERLEEIVKFLGASSRRGRSELASFLLDASGEYRETITRTIDQQLRDNATLKRARPLSTHGEHSFTLWIWSPPVTREAAAAEQHTKSVMAANGERCRLLVELEYTARGELADVHWRNVGLAGLSNTELARVRNAGVALRRQRVAAARAKRKIGANESCPCGSGRKYKRCCRP